MTNVQKSLRKSILVVEDDVGVRDAISDILCFSGFHVDAVEDAEKALELAITLSKEYFAIITDFQLPKLNGKQLLQRLFDEGKEYERVLVISSLNPWDPEIRSLSDLGRSRIVHFLPKPFSMTMLLKLIEPDY